MAAAVGWFADPIFLGKESYLMRELLGDRLPTFTPEEMLLVKDSSDFYGCNTCRSEDLGINLLYQTRPTTCVMEARMNPWAVPSSRSRMHRETHWEIHVRSEYDTGDADR